MIDTQIDFKYSQIIIRKKSEEGYCTETARQHNGTVIIIRCGKLRKMQILRNLGRCLVEEKNQDDIAFAISS